MYYAEIHPKLKSPIVSAVAGHFGCQEHSAEWWLRNTEHDINDVMNSDPASEKYSEYLREIIWMPPLELVNKWNERSRRR